MAKCNALVCVCVCKYDGFNLFLEYFGLRARIICVCVCVCVCVYMAK